MAVYEKLIAVQSELKAPKNQFNKFGKFYYRNCEDILEALKPILKKHKATTFISDEIVVKENGSAYIKATVTFVDVETGETVSNTAYAKEGQGKNGMDPSQATGATSSYARKYALNGMYCIDDTKDADTDEYKVQTEAKKDTEAKKEVSADRITPAQLKELNGLLKAAGYNTEKVNNLKAAFGVSRLDELSKAQFDAVMSKVEGEFNGN